METRNLVVRMWRGSVDSVDGLEDGQSYELLDKDVYGNGDIEYVSELNARYPEAVSANGLLNFERVQRLSKQNEDCPLTLYVCNGEVVSYQVLDGYCVDVVEDE